MSARPTSRKHGELQREAIWRLHLEGKSQTRIRAICAQGYADLDPFTIDRSTISRIIRDVAATRETADGRELATSQPDIAIKILLAESIRIAQRHLSRLKSNERQGKLDLVDFRRFLGILRDLRSQADSLAPARPAGEAAAAERDRLAFLDIDDHEAAAQRDPQSTPTATGDGKRGESEGSKRSELTTAVHTSEDERIRVNAQAQSIPTNEVGNENARK